MSLLVFKVTSLKNLTSTDVYSISSITLAFIVFSRLVLPITFLKILTSGSVNPSDVLQASLTSLLYYG